MIESNLFQKAVDLIEASGRILVTTHTRPDGDAVGSVVAMCDVLQRLGKQPMPLFLSLVPPWYRFLLTESVPVLGQDIQADDLKTSPYGQADLIVLLDVNSRPQLSKFAAYLDQCDVPVLVIDHHAVSDGLGTLELIDTSAAATGLLIKEFIDAANRAMTAKMAEALFVATATDTGWFQFNNADSRTYRGAADLIDAGASPPQIYQKLFQDFTYARFKLSLAMLNTLELWYGDQLAVQYLRQIDFDQTGANYEDTENLINECFKIGSIKASVLLVELKDGRIRCSLRSRSDVNVGEIAAKFGGGGHKMASGTFLEPPLEKAKEQIIREFSLLDAES